MNPTPSERRCFALACLAAMALVAACGEVDAPGTPDTTTPPDTSDTGTTRDPIETQGNTTIDLGTQVGSEGIWGCQITSVTAIGPDDMVPDTDTEISKATGDLTGGWMLLLDIVDRGTEDGGLFLDTPTRLALVETDGDCGPYVEARVAGVLDRADLTVAVEGVLALSADASALRLAAPSADGDVREAWGDPSGVELKYLRIDGELDIDGTALTGAVRHAECLELSCPTEDLALFAGNR